MQRPLPADCCIFGRFGRLSSAAFHSADCRFKSGSFWSEMMNPCFIVTYRRKKSFLFRVNSAKQLSESSMRCCFYSIVSKRSTHLEKSFFIAKYWCKIVKTLPIDNFMISAISRTFIFWSFIMIFRTYLMFSFSHCFIWTARTHIQRHLCPYNHVWNQHTTDKWLNSTEQSRNNTC